MATGYDAFISYSHAADGKLAPSLQTALQHFAKPWYRLRALHLFRDQTSLSATPGLWPAIEAALKGSRYFLLLASPEAAASRWVQQEVSWWLEHKSPQTLLIALTDGRIVRPPGGKDFDWEATDALPPNLKGVFTENPLWVDFRWAKGQEHLSTKNPEFQNALAALAAPLRNLPKEDLIGEDVKQHRHALFLARGAVIVLVLLVVASLSAAFIALAKGHEATEQARISAMRGLSAESDRQSAASKDELAALLAREAYLASQRGEDSFLGQLESRLFRTVLDPAVLAPVDEALRGALGVPYFASEAYRQAGRIDTVAYSADGALFAAGGTVFVGDPTGGAATESNGTVRLWHLPNRGGSPTVLSGGPGFLLDMSISPDGEYVAAVGMVNGQSNNGYVSLWDVKHPESGPEVLTTCGGQINAVAFSADGRWLAAGGTAATSGDAPLHVWDMTRLEDPECLSFGATFIMSLAFNPLAPQIAIGNDGGRVWLANLADQHQPVPLEGLTSSADALAFSPNGKQLAAGSKGGEVGMWDLTAPDRPAVVRKEDPFSVSAVAFSPDAGTLAIGGSNGRVYLRDLTAADPEAVAEHFSLETDVMDVAFSPDDNFLAVGGTRLNPPTGTVWLVDPGASASAPTVLATMANLVAPIAFGLDSRSLTAMSSDGTVVRWDLGDPVAAPEPIATLASGDIPLAISRDASTLAVQKCVEYDDVQMGCARSEVRLLDLGAPSTPGVVLAAPATSADVLVPYPGAVVPGAFSPDGRMLAMGGSVAGNQLDGRIALWDVSDPERPPRVLAGHQGSVNSVAFSPDGLLFASASWAGTNRVSRGEARLWDVRDLAAGSRLLGGTAPTVGSIGFRPDGRAIIATATGQIWTWDIANPEGSPVAIEGTGGGVNGAAFSPDGRFLAGDGVTYESGQLALVWLWYVGHSVSAPIPLEVDAAPWFSQVAFSPDGGTLAAVGGDGKIRLWTVRASTLSDIVCDTVLRNLTTVEWNRYVGTGGPTQLTCPDLPLAASSPTPTADPLRALASARGPAS